VNQELENILTVLHKALLNHLQSTNEDAAKAHRTLSRTSTVAANTVYTIFNTIANNIQETLQLCAVVLPESIDDTEPLLDSTELSELPAGPSNSHHTHAVQVQLPELTGGGESSRTTHDLRASQFFELNGTSTLFCQGCQPIWDARKEAFDRKILAMPDEFDTALLAADAKCRSSLDTMKRNEAQWNKSLADQRLRFQKSIAHKRNFIPRAVASQGRRMEGHCRGMAC
jgi:hypothetical protein